MRALKVLTLTILALTIPTRTMLRASPQQVVPAQSTMIRDEPVASPTVVYPEEARKARVQGTVHLQISVDAHGNVTEVQALDGPTLLRQAAIDAYTHAVYRPIVVKGAPAPAIVTTSVSFKLNELPPNTDQLVMARFHPLQRQCQELAQRHEQEALTVCREALEMASHFVTRTFDLEAHTTAYNDVVLILIADGKKSSELPEAGVLADQAVELVKLSVRDNPHSPAVAVAYITRCEVRSLAGDLKGAALDCAVAEETLTTLLHDYPKNERSANYRVQLRETLQLHAVIAERDHQSTEARKLRRRAAVI